MTRETLEPSRVSGPGPRDQPAWRTLGAIVVSAAALALVVQTVVLQGFANSGDENAYLWQATAFAQGRITAESPEPQAAFRLSHVGDVAGRRFCKYPPGWPLLLAAGVLMRVPWLVNPILAAIALAGIYQLGCAWIGRRAAMLGTIFIGCSPFFLLNAASYHSHPSCLLAMTFFALSLSRAADRPDPVSFAAAGASLGLAVLIRPYTAFLLAAPLLVGLGWTAFTAMPHDGTRRPTPAGRLLWFALGGLPFALVLAAVNHAVTGSYVALAWTAFDPTERLGFGVHGHTFWRGIKTTAKLCLEGVRYTALASPLLLAVAVGGVPRRGAVLWAMLLVPIAGHVFWWSDGGNRYGPRFYFETLLPLTLLAGVGLARLVAWRHGRALATVGAGLAVVAFADVSVVHHAQIYARRALYRTVEAAGLRHAVVLLTTASSDMVRADLTRNPPDYRSANVLYAMSRGALDAEVLSRYSDRAIYYYRWSEDGGVIWRATTGGLPPTR